MLRPIVLGLLLFGLQLVAEPVAAQGGAQVVVRAGAVAPGSTGITHDGYTARGSLGFEIGSLVAWKATEGLHLRADLIWGRAASRRATSAATAPTEHWPTRTH